MSPSRPPPRRISRPLGVGPVDGEGRRAPRDGRGGTRVRGRRTPALWHRWLDATRRREHLLALPDRAARHRWADAAARAVTASGYGLAEMLAQRVASHPGRTLFAAGPNPGAHRAGATHTSPAAPTRSPPSLLALEEEPRVAIVSENGLDSACVDLACLLHGLLVSPLSPHLTPGELTAAFDALGVNLAVVSSEESLRRLRETARHVGAPVPGRPPRRGGRAGRSGRRRPRRGARGPGRRLGPRGARARPAPRASARRARSSSRRGRPAARRGSPSRWRTS